MEEVSEPSYAPLIGKADALVIRTQPLSAATIADAARLKIVSRHGVGYDSVDVAALNKRADSAVRRRRRELAVGRRTRDDADPRLRKAGDPRRPFSAERASGGGATGSRLAKSRASAC